MLTSALGAARLRVPDRHALLDHPLHAQQADAELVLDQLADRLDAAVAQVVDVVGAGPGRMTCCWRDHRRHDLHQVFLGQHARG